MRYPLLILSYLFVALVAFLSAMIVPYGINRVLLILSAIITLILGVYNLVAEKKREEFVNEQLDRKIEAEECGDKTDYPDVTKAVGGTGV